MNKIKYTKGKYATGEVTQNSQVIEHFLTDNKEVGTKNLSTHYDADTGVVRLKNYATIIAERDGNNVRLSTKKYSVTTSKIQNEVRGEAKSMGLNIVDREMFMKGGITGDVYSIENPEQFKQLITVYNELTENLENLVKGYYLDHADKSIVFLTTPNISDIGKDKVVDYVRSLKDKGFTIFDWNKTLRSGYLDWGTEKGSMVKEHGTLSNRKSNPQWFKMYLKGFVKYSDGGMMYANGGEIESQIKERLANASFELPLECIVYVPSTRDANAIIPKNEMQQRVKEVQKFLSNLFGGYSSANVDGGYVSSDKGLIQEDVVKVTAFATKDAIQKSMPKLVKRIQQWCNQWSQESMGFEFEGDLFYISKDSTFSNGGTMYGDGGELSIGTEIVGSKKLYFVYNAKSGKKSSYYDSEMEAKNQLNKMRNNLVRGMMYGDGGTAEEQNKHMILSQAKQVAHHVEELQEILAKDPTIDSWVVAKMQDVSTGLSNITHYLDGKSEYALGGEIILGGGSMASVQDSIMAKGGMTEHGLRQGDKIIGGKIIGTTIRVRNDAFDEDARVDLNTGKRTILVYDKKTRKFIEKAANGAKLKSGKLTISKLKSMIEEYNSEGRNFELGGAYNQLELWSNGNRLEAGSKEDIYRALVRYRFNPKYADGAELPEEIDFSTMTDEEIINFANTLSYYDRMDEGIEEEFDDVEDAKEYILLMEKGV